MAFSISASTWNDEQSDISKIIMAPLLAGATFPLLAHAPGITGFNQKLPVFETTGTEWQSNSSCGFNTSGTTTISQFTMTTVPITLNEAVCLKDLAPKFTTAWLPAGSQWEESTIINLWIQRKLAKLAFTSESAIWQAATTQTNIDFLKHFNGFLATIDAAGDAVTATATAAITSSNIIGIFDEIIFTKLMTIPQIFQEQPVVFCSMEHIFMLVQAYKALNLFHYAPEVNPSTGAMTMVYPGTPIKVIAVPGLNSTNASGLRTSAKNRIVATFPSNLVIGYNAENDVNGAKVWYSDDNDQVRMRINFYLGVGVKYTNLCVTYANS